MGAYVMCFVLLAIGIYAILAHRNVIKIIIGVLIAQCAIHLFLVLISFRRDGEAPLHAAEDSPALMVDPLPHAMVLTAIVVGLATTVLLVALAIRIYDKYGTYDIDKIRELRG